MANFEDFIKVTNEAQKNIDLMKENIQRIDDEITAINDNKYERVKAFWSEVGQMFKMYNIIGKLFKTPLIDRYGSTIYFKVYIGYKDLLEIGVYSDINGFINFIQWMPFKENCKRFMDKNDDSDVISEIKDILVNHWEEYEKKFEVIIKEFVTKIMAERIDREKDRYEQTVNELAKKTI